MKKTLSIFMALLLCLQVSACAWKMVWKYDFPEYNQFIEEMEEKYPKFKIQFSSMSNLSARNIYISGEIPPEDYYDIFIQLLNLLTGDGYVEFCKGIKEGEVYGVYGISIAFSNKKSGKEESFFNSNYVGDSEKNENEPYKGFYHWGIGLADGLSGNDNTMTDIWYQDGVFIRKILGSYEEEPFNYQEYFGFDA